MKAEEWVDRVLTQYRESPKLLHVIRTYIGQLVDIFSTIENLGNYFDLDTAVGDQLTIIGKWMGWPREHCVCDPLALYGFDCEPLPQTYQIAGMCDTATWKGCDTASLGTISLDDDELYRKFLQVRAYQMTAKFSVADLERAIQIFWGDTAIVLQGSLGRVVIAPGRDLTEQELSVIQLYPRVLPIAPGILTKLHLWPVPVAGFGIGWEGFCEVAVDDATYDPTGDGDFIDPTGSSDMLATGVLYRGGYWMCEFDPKPYDCNN